MKLFGATLFALAVLALTLPAVQAATVISATDRGSYAWNSRKAQLAWTEAVAGRELDDLEGLTGRFGESADILSAKGGRFSTTDDRLRQVNNRRPLNVPVLTGSYLALLGDGPVSSFTWSLPRAANGFAFSAWGNHGGSLVISFTENGDQQSYFMQAAEHVSDGSLFWGIYGLKGTVSTVTISTTDRSTGWDNFSIAATVPIPPALPLLGFGIAALAWSSRKGRRSPT